jgi:AcrR family transcriptional regulator
MFVYGQTTKECSIIIQMIAKDKKEDRRTNRTRQTLHAALIQLILEKHYDLITVQDIIDRANVGRSTFYVHFRDKEDLLVSDWERFLDMFVANLNWANLDEGKLVPFSELLYHLKDFHPFYRALVKSQKSERLFKIGCSYLAQSFQKELTNRFDQSSIKIPLPIVATYLSNEIFCQLRWWLDNNMPNSPEEMSEIFHTLVMSGVRKSLAKS